jgi:hypothetical protein
MSDHDPGCACHGPGTRSAGDGYCLHKFKYLDATETEVFHTCPTCMEAWVYGLQSWTDEEKVGIRVAAAAYRREHRVR